MVHIRTFPVIPANGEKMLRDRAKGGKEERKKGRKRERKKEREEERKKGRQGDSKNGRNGMGMGMGDGATFLFTQQPSEGAT